jgi:hypothetical protein
MSFFNSQRRSKGIVGQLSGNNLRVFRRILSQARNPEPGKFGHVDAYVDAYKVTSTTFASAKAE